ncbi:MAG: hypothetical protein HY302_04290 [Opitutae bacterium]|nr:hypothetical protein [Opitutae bacterium]
MKYFALTCLFVAFAIGCRHVPKSPDPWELLSHQVNPPAIHRWGDPWPGFDGDNKRYTYAYESAWWACIEIFARDIDHQVTVGDKAGNGWPAEVDGYWAGFSDAELRVRAIIGKFGKEKAQELLKKASLAPET